MVLTASLLHLLVEPLPRWLCCFSEPEGDPGEGEKGISGHKAQRLHPPHPEEDSEEMSVVRNWFKGGRDFLPLQPQPSQKDKHQLPLEDP